MPSFCVIGSCHRDTSPWEANVHQGSFPCLETHRVDNRWPSFQYPVFPPSGISNQRYRFCFGLAFENRCIFLLVWFLQNLGRNKQRTAVYNDGSRLLFLSLVIIFSDCTTMLVFCFVVSCGLSAEFWETSVEYCTQTPKTVAVCIFFWAVRWIYVICYFFLGF